MENVLLLLFARLLTLDEKDSERMRETDGEHEGDTMWSRKKGDF